MDKVIDLVGETLDTIFMLIDWLIEIHQEDNKHDIVLHLMTIKLDIVEDEY